MHIVLVVCLLGISVEYEQLRNAFLFIIFFISVHSQCIESCTPTFIIFPCLMLVSSQHVTITSWISVEYWVIARPYIKPLHLYKVNVQYVFVWTERVYRYMPEGAITINTSIVAQTQSTRLACIRTRPLSVCLIYLNANELPVALELSFNSRK